MRYFTRGGQVIIHQITMWVQVIIKLTAFFALVYALLFAGMLYHKTSNFERKLVWQYWLADTFSGDNVKLLVEWNNGRTYSVLAGEFLASPEIKDTVTQIQYRVITASRKLAWLAGFLYALSIGFLIYKGFRMSRGRFVRGARIVAAGEFTRRLKRRFRASSITLGGVPLVKHSQHKHILMVGSTGSGKTQGILELLGHFRDEGYKVIVLDPECDAIQRFYRESKKLGEPDHDIILNPLDVRARPLSFWDDARNESQLEYIAASLLPEANNGADPFWNKAAQVLFLNAAMDILKRRHTHEGDIDSKPGIRDLLKLLVMSDVKELEQRMKNTMAESLVNRDSEKLALSVKAMLAANLRCLELLEDVHNGFSIRNWVHEKNDSWLFITSRDDKEETFKPLLSMMLDIVANELLTLPASRARKIALVIDEEASLNPSRSLQQLRQRGRKRGICIVSAYQTLSQATALSGVAAKQTLSSMYGTRVYFACNDADSAKQASLDLGQQEIIETVESISLGANSMRDGVTISQQRRTVDLVMPEQITTLNERFAYLKVPGNHPVTRIEAPICLLPTTQSDFIAKEMPLFTKKTTGKEKEKAAKSVTSNSGQTDGNTHKDDSPIVQPVTVDNADDAGFLKPRNEKLSKQIDDDRER